MRNIASKVKTYQLIAPQDAPSTVTGTGLQFTPNELTDAVAVVSLGAVTGTPTSFTAIVTIEQSDTVNGTYSVSQTFATATAANQAGHKAVALDPAKPFVRAKATLAFVGGTTPSVVVGVNILVAQNNNSDSNAVALA